VCSAPKHERWSPSHGGPEPRMRFGYDDSLSAFS
jgi:hypothetical protein